MEKSSQNNSRSFANKRKNRIRLTVSIVLLVFFAVGIAVSSYHISTILLENRSADKAYEQLRTDARQTRPIEEEGRDDAVTENNPRQEEKNEAEPQRQQSVDVAALQADYPDIVGWILAEGTGIDYPVVQAKDNDYYLYRLYDGSQNANGSIFMDYRNTGFFTDDNTVLYGHNMQSGTMFHVLNEYKFQGFYDTHPTMVVSTPEGDYLIELLAGTVEDGNYEFVRFSFDGFEDMCSYVAQIQSRSTFASDVELQPGDRLISLCTCTYERQNGRFMLLGRVTELYE